MNGSLMITKLHTRRSGKSFGRQLHAMLSVWILEMAFTMGADGL